MEKRMKEWVAVLRAADAAAAVINGTREAAEAADIQKSLATKGGCEAALISSDYHWTQQT
jgi:uncharacterized protein YbjT (DUF2867 family)